MSIKPIVVSIIIPTYNERDNIAELVARLEAALKPTRKPFELIFIDDRSPDGTAKALRTVAHTAPLKIHTKKGEQGKAFSILEGLTYAQGSLIAFIDADLQYPPEVLPEMLQLLEDHDIVVAERAIRHTTWLRTLLSRTFRAFFGRFLLGINVDVQAGLKAFRRSVVDNVELQPSAWGLDYQLLYGAKRQNASIVGVPIIFAERKHGESTINATRVSLELAWGAISLRANSLKEDFQTYFSKQVQD